MSWDYEIVPLNLKHPFRIARTAEQTVRRVVLLRVHDGFGEASPAAYFQETPESVVATLREFEHAIGDDLRNLDAVLDRADALVSGAYSAKCALDLALHDYWGKQLQLPLHAIWGASPQLTVPTSFTVGLDEPDVMQQKALELPEEQFPILKVKLGSDRDMEIMRALRAVTDRTIRVDANTAWDIETARRMCRELADMNVDLVEQPLPADDFAGLRELKRASPLPIIADESARRTMDIAPLADCVDGINIKLDKCGGLREARQMVRFARSRGLKIMLGCMVATSLSITAMAHLGAAADFLDLDGHLLVTNDPFTGITLKHGVPVLPDAPGIGAVPRPLEHPVPESDLSVQSE